MLVAQVGFMLGFYTRFIFEQVDLTEDIKCFAIISGRDILFFIEKSNV